MRSTVTLIVVAALVGCHRDTSVSMEDATADHSYTPPAEPPAAPPAPATAAPLAIGGGPAAEAVYSVPAAIGVLVTARCHCGEGDDCEGRTAAELAPLTTECTRGVRSTTLADCADRLRQSACYTPATTAVCDVTELCVR